MGERRRMIYLERLYRTRQLFRQKELEFARTPRCFGDLAGQREKSILLFIKKYAVVNRSDIIAHFTSPQNFRFYNNAFTENNIETTLTDLEYYGFIESTHREIKVTKIGLKFLDKDK